MRPPRPRRSSPAALAGALLGLVVLAAGCSSGQPDASPERSPSPAGSASAAAPPDAGPSGADPAPSSSTDPDPLAPAEVLTVGTNRAVSPCQLLGPDDVESIAGPITGTAKVLETFLSSSFDKTGDARSVRTSCSYDVPGGVDLTALQYVPGSRTIQELDLVVDTLKDDSAVLTRMAALEDAVADPANGAGAQTQAFVGELRAGLDEAQASAAVLRKGTFSDPVYDGKVLPRAGSLTFRFFVADVTYDLTLGSTLEDDPLALVTGPQIVELLDGAAEVVTLVRERAADPTLSQAPVRTVLGPSDVVGQSPIIEPCSVLSGAVVDQLTGLPGAPTTERLTFPATAAERPSRTTGNPTLPLATCTRDAVGVTRDAESGSRELRLELQIADTPERLRQLLRIGGYLEKTPGTRRLQTDADYAQAGRPTDTDDGPSRTYTFTLGPYFATITVADVVSTGELFAEVHRYPADEADHVAAINALVATITELETGSATG